MSCCIGGRRWITTCNGYITRRLFLCSTHLCRQTWHSHGHAGSVCADHLTRSVGVSVYHSAIHWITFIILIYWVDQRVARYRLASFTTLTKSLLRITSLVLPIVTSLYMVTALHTNYVLTQFENLSHSILNC